MPFCTQCGHHVDDTASYCAQCGKAQPRAGFAQPGSDFLSGISERNASILCYIPVFGIIPSIIFLAAHKFRHNQRVRFDGFQSIYLFVAYLILTSVGHCGPASLFELLTFVLWIFLLVKAAQNEQVRLPILGDLAARSAAEQL